MCDAVARSPAPVWTHSYALGGATVTGAFLDLFIAGFADVGSVDLLADGAVIATFDFVGLFQRVHSLTTAIPLAAIDGSTVFSLSGPGGDGYIIDHSVLRVETAMAAPEPVSLMLMGLGIAGLGFAARKRA